MDRPLIEPQSLAKSCNEALILACLEEGARHGYQIALDIEEKGGGYFRFNHGTLYPSLLPMLRLGGRKCPARRDSKALFRVASAESPVVEKRP